MSSEQAMTEYVDEVMAIDFDWEDKVTLTQEYS